MFPPWRVAVRSPAVAGGVCVAIGAASVLPAAYDLGKMVCIALGQVHGPAQGTDFLNLYAGARLLLTDPRQTYDLAVQHGLQQSLTGWDSPIVPFYLPPYAALLLSWLAWLPYGLASLVWLALGIGCVGLAASWLAPRWTRWHTPVWLGLSLLFLPCLLGLAQGQTSAVALLATTAFSLGLLDRSPATARLGLGLLGLALKPQFAPAFVCALLVARRWRALGLATLLIGVLGAAALVRLGPDGVAAYSRASGQKLAEALTADPGFLLGPTVLHASHWFLGSTLAADLVALAIDLAVVAVAVFVWRDGLREDQARLLQLAMLPLVSILVAPYALVYELTTWLVSFWLVCGATRCRPVARAVWLWWAAGVWLAGDVGVMQPLAGGADVAAVLGVCGVAYLGWLYRASPRPTRCTG